MPFTAFSEYKKVKNAKPELVWFALDEEQSLAFLTTEPNAEVGAVHPKAMPAILTEPDEVDQWLTADNAEALELQRPLPDGALEIVGHGKRGEFVENVE